MLQKNIKVFSLCQLTSDMADIYVKCHKSAITDVRYNKQNMPIWVSTEGFNLRNAPCINSLRTLYPLHCDSLLPTLFILHAPPLPTLCHCSCTNTQAHLDWSWGAVQLIEKSLSKAETTIKQFRGGWVHSEKVP